MKTPLYAGLVLVVAMAIMGTVAYINHLKGERDALQATATVTALELAGAKQALSVRPKEVIRFVEVPQAVKAAVKSGNLTPVTGIKVTATSDPLSIPCPEPEVVPTGQPGPPGPRFVNISFGLKAGVFVGLVKAGPPMATLTLEGTVYGEGFSSPVKFSTTDVNVVFSKDITAAIKAYQEPWLKKHTAFACPGIGIVYNPLNARPVDLALTCGYSLVWF